MTKVTKEPNYTVKQEAQLKEMYTANPVPETVEALVEMTGKNKRSIVAKLSNMGIYVVPERTTKAGTPVVKKETLVAEIGAKLEGEFPSLIKANKRDLEKLVECLAEWFGGDAA